jgi:putative hydrolase of the HAD superfamily
MGMKNQAVDAAIDAMVDAGIGLDRTEVKSRIDAIYKERGIEYQQVFDDHIYDIFQKLDQRDAPGRPWR